MKKYKTELNIYDLKWPTLLQGTLIKRYQRFKADVRLRNGHVVTAHCPNSGSMLCCSEPGRPAYLSRHDNPGRKFKHTWEMIEMPTSLVGINTMVPNWLTKKAISRGKIRALAGYERIRAEVKYGQNSRIDLLLEKDSEKCFVEVKNCTLVEGEVAYFPDAVTSRGLKHLLELQRMVHEEIGASCFIWFKGWMLRNSDRRTKLTLTMDRNSERRSRTVWRSWSMTSQLTLRAFD